MDSWGGASWRAALLTSCRSVRSSYPSGSKPFVSTDEIHFCIDEQIVDGAGDSGDNNLQNYPLLTDALTDQVGSVTVTGLLNSTALTAFRIEFFASSDSGRQADRFIGAVTVTTDASGNAMLSPILAALVFAGEYITATATVELGGGFFGDTSELAATVVASSPQEAPQNMRYETGRADGAQSRVRPQERPQEISPCGGAVQKRGQTP